eukprot:5715961-Amphidinium_carterae.1
MIIRNTLAMFMAALVGDPTGCLQCAACMCAMRLCNLTCINPNKKAASIHVHPCAGGGVVVELGPIRLRPCDSAGDNRVPANAESKHASTQYQLHRSLLPSGMISKCPSQNAAPSLREHHHGQKRDVRVTIPEVGNMGTSYQLATSD